MIAWNMIVKIKRKLLLNSSLYFYYIFKYMVHQDLFTGLERKLKKRKQWFYSKCNIVTRKDSVYYFVFFESKLYYKSYIIKMLSLTSQALPKSHPKISLVGSGYRIRWLQLCRWVKHLQRMSWSDSKPSDDKATFLEFWGMWSIFP